jgi:TPR repeat protein
MKRGAVAEDKAELIKWWDAIDMLSSSGGVEKGLNAARECKHPDAQWLASLFPPGVEVSQRGMAEVLLEQGEDPRALYLARELIGGATTEDGLARAAKMDYAPAQAAMALKTEDEASFAWAQKSASAGDRRGLFRLGQCWYNGRGCAKDTAKAMLLYREAAERGNVGAMFSYAQAAFGELDWERFYWLGRVAQRGLCGVVYCRAIRGLLQSFELGENGRILHTVALTVRASFDVQQRSAFGTILREAEHADLLRIVALHDAMLERARRAIACWEVVARRCGLVKDIRVLIGKTLWEEAWRWS